MRFPQFLLHLYHIYENEEFSIAQEMLYLSFNSWSENRNFIVANNYVRHKTECDKMVRGEFGL